jgi:hypothetical protein
MCLLREVIDESVDCSQTYDITGAPDFEALDYKEKDAESLVCHEKDKRTLTQFTWARPERTEAGPPAAESAYEKTASQAADLDQMKQELCEELVHLSNAAQSSTEHRGVAARAIDGNRDGNYFHHSCTHSAGTRNESWTADMAAGFSPTKVVIANRQDCCAERIIGTRVFIDGVHCGTVSTATEKITIPAGACGNARTDSTSRIEVRSGDAPLTLCEVEVFGRRG